MNQYNSSFFTSNSNLTTSSPEFNPNLNESTSYTYSRDPQQNTDADYSEWYEVSCVEAGSGNDKGDSIQKVAFDPTKELVWAGTASGMLHSHHVTDMSRIVSTYIGEPSDSTPDVRDVVVSSNSVLTAMNYGLAIVSKSGVCSSSIRTDTIKNAKGIALNPLSENHVCIGGESRMLAVLDLPQLQVLRQANLRGATGVTNALWAAPDGASSICLFSTATGRLSFCDPSTMREINAIAAFSGAITSISSNGYYITATGFGTRNGIPYLEQGIKIYDIRSLETPLPSVPFPPEPLFTTFDTASASYYGSDSALWVLSPSGLMQLLDISTGEQNNPSYPLINPIQLDAASDMFTSMTVSPQGLLALGDTGGFIHLWSASDIVKVNDHSDPIWDSPVPSDPPPSSISLDQMLTSEVGTSIPKCAIQEYGDVVLYLTDHMFDMAPDEAINLANGFSTGRRNGPESKTLPNLYTRPPFAAFPRVVSNEVLSSAKYQSFVGYAQSPAGFIRNSQSGHAKPPTVRAYANSYGEKGIIKSRIAKARSMENVTEGKTRDENAAVDLSKPACKSKYVEMDLVAWESMEGFNFSKYNTSGLFCGLENALPNVYVNPVVQVLYFSPAVRQAIGAHSCDQEWCISCELGFLFHMFDLGGAGMACEAGNFTRAFMTMANAGALGLLDGPLALPLDQRIENFSRYLFEQLHKDEVMKNDNVIADVFGAKTISQGIYMPSKIPWEKISFRFQHTLVYPQPGKDAQSFSEVLQRSLSHSMDTTRAFCEETGQFESLSLKREIRSLPNVLLLGCNTKSSEYNSWWLGESADVSENKKGETSNVIHRITTLAMQRKKKLAESIHIEIGNGVHVTEELGSSEGTQPYGYNDSNNIESELLSDDSRADYDLSFVVVHVPPTESSENSDESRSISRDIDGHLVAYIRVPQEYRDKKNKNDSEKSNIPNGEWWCFNDFVISCCEGFEEVAAFDKRWKKPCLLGYVRRDFKNRIKPKIISKPTSIRDVIGEEDHNVALGLKADEEIPGKGTVLALDCEFVMVGRDEAEIFGDGSRRIVTPARMALARVSVIRGSGSMKGTALIDDYVAVREPVVDYLTRYSGLSEGDLDAERSAFKVSKLKTVYKRLRCLVDAGCTFVGHGLKSDFRIINFVVPSEQVVDTVTLFRIRNKRLLSLRFLSSALLNSDIQSETHDSIEDSLAALMLYELYKSIVSGARGKERFEQLLRELYSYGFSHGWKVDENDRFIIPPE